MSPRLFVLPLLGRLVSPVNRNYLYLCLDPTWCSRDRISCLLALDSGARRGNERILSPKGRRIRLNETVFQALPVHLQQQRRRGIPVRAEAVVLGRGIRQRTFEMSRLVIDVEIERYVVQWQARVNRACLLLVDSESRRDV